MRHEPERRRKNVYDLVARSVSKRRFSNLGSSGGRERARRAGTRRLFIFIPPCQQPTMASRYLLLFVLFSVCFTAKENPKKRVKRILRRFEEFKCKKSLRRFSFQLGTLSRGAGKRSTRKISSFFAS